MTDSLQLSEDQRDCLQETVNVAMGRAGDSLARLLEVFVTLSVPRIRLLAPTDVYRLVAGENICATRQAFQDNNGKDGWRGEALIVFGESSFAELAELLHYDDHSAGEVQQELLLDISNVLNCACLAGIADQLGVELFYSPPSILGHGTHIASLLDQDHLQWESALSVDINYRLENRAFHCDLLLLMPDSAITHLAENLDRLLDEL